MTRHLLPRQISDDEVINYMSDELFERLKDDSIKSVADVTEGAYHLGFYSGDRLVGVFSLGLFDDYAMLHPKINREHMIYAKRICDAAVNFACNAGYKSVIAKFPHGKRNTKRMAESAGMSLVTTLEGHKSINGKAIDIDVYRRVF